MILSKDVKVAALQETKLSKTSKLSEFCDYTLVRKDRIEREGGGLAFLIHKSLQFQTLPSPIKDKHFECQVIKISDITLVNVYLPPKSSCPPGHTASLAPLLDIPDAIILGDLNAHDPLWHSSIQDQRGEVFSEEISDSDCGVINEDTPTRVPVSGQPTSPDLSIVSLSLLPTAHWSTLKTLGSDHLPIIVHLTTTIKTSRSDNKTFINFKKADWDTFKTSTEEEFAKLSPPSNVYKAEKKFRKIINKASKRCIPSGRIKDVLPEIPASAAENIKKRDQLRETNPNSEEITNLNYIINKEIREHKREKWREQISKIEKGKSGHLFKIIKNLNGNTKASKNQAISFNNKPISCPAKIANKFNKQYSSVVTHKTSKEARRIAKDVKKNQRLQAPTYTTEQTKEELKKCKPSKALGPDMISNLHLKHLGDHGVAFLTSIFNLSLATGLVPDIWKQSVIIPLLKPGKDPSVSTSYRPVSLLSPAIKIMERLLLPSLTEHLEVPAHQHGFR